MPLQDKTILITGAGVRVGRSLALAVAHLGADVLIHYHHSSDEANQIASQVRGLGRRAETLSADLNDPQQVSTLMERALGLAPLYALVNNASIFEDLNWQTTTLEGWNRHLMVNLTAPFLLSQAFARSLPPDQHGRIINLLDWRALRPGVDHLPYTISKAGLAALTRALARSLAPRICVNGLALGAVLPPTDGGDLNAAIRNVPAGRWARLEEVDQSLAFLLTGPAYITGEILHVDGGRHVV
jgi:NAD(P)-dependent dehydrogenase (short-subunit alcohol dehydrogenase family)